jgi:hypothetical protein
LNLQRNVGCVSWNPKATAQPLSGTSITQPPIALQCSNGWIEWRVLPIFYSCCDNIVDGSGKCPGRFQVVTNDERDEQNDAEIISPVVYVTLFTFCKSFSENVYHSQIEGSARRSQNSSENQSQYGIDGLQFFRLFHLVSIEKAKHENFICPIPGCGDTFTRSYDLIGVSSRYLGSMSFHISITPHPRSFSIS